MNLLINGSAQQFQNISTVADLIRVLGYAGRRVAIERNGDIVPRSQHTRVQLADNDEIEIVVAVGGG